MTFIENSKKLYNGFYPVFSDKFPELAGRAAFAVAGSGSEFFGFEDELSHDHDYEEGFCIFLTEDDDIKYSVPLRRLYREYVPSSKTAKSAFSSSRLGVMTIPEFYERHIGIPRAPETFEEWMYIPSYALFEASDGEVFSDPLGEFSSIREQILHGMPEDVKKKKIAARCALAAQSGQYNFKRCLVHGEKGSAVLACDDFVRNISELVFLLNRAHAPYYKWIFRAMDSLPVLGRLREDLETLLISPIEGRQEQIEKIAFEIIEELKNQGLSDSKSDYLEDHAISVQGRIENASIRSMHIMEG